MPWTIADQFRIPENKAIVDFILKHPTLSAHDEVAEVLMKSGKDFPDVKSYCPNLPSYAYVLLHTGNKVFGIAFGQRALVFRLPKEEIKAALSAGGKVYADIGENWISFDPWQTVEPVNASRWCKVAHDYILTI